jgi:hypothetical protein
MSTAQEASNKATFAARWVDATVETTREPGSLARIVSADTTSTASRRTSYVSIYTRS